MFAGIGGFRSGLAKFGDFFVPVGFCEIDPYARRAYEAIYDTKGELFFEDARQIDPEELPDIDLICGGFPCQSFSIAGKRGGFEDARGTLFFEIARIARVKRPKYLLLENVPGLLSHDGGRTFATHAMNAAMIYYNKDLFDKKGVAYPTADWTWDDMLEKAKVLAYDETGDGVNDYIGISWAGNITLGWLPMMLSFGLEPIDETYTKAQIDTPEVKRAWDEQINWREAGLTGDRDLSQLYPNPWQGRVAMWIGQASYIQQYNDNAPDFNYDIQVLPKGPNGDQNCVYVPNMWAIYSRADQTGKDAAWDFIKYYYNEESQEICAKYKFGGFPIRISVYENMGETKPANIKGIIEGIDQRGHTLCEGPGWKEWRVIVEKAYQDYISETPTKPLDQILADTQKEVQRVLDEANAKIAQ